MAQAAQLDEEPKTRAEIEADPYGSLGVQSPDTISPKDAEWLTLMRQKQAADLEKQRTETQIAQQQAETAQEEKFKAQLPLQKEALGLSKARTAEAEKFAQEPVPSIQPPPKLQNFLDKDTASGMAAIASVIAGFNTNGRIRGIRANQSLAAGINGYMKGSYDRALLGFQDWQNQVYAQTLEWKMMRQQHQDILNARGMTIEDKMAEIELAGAPYDNEITRAAARSKNIDAILKIDKELDGLINSAEKTMAKANPLIQHLTVEEKKWNIRAKALGYPDINAAPPGVQNQIMSDIAGLRAQAYQQERQKYQLWARTDAPIEQKQVINWMDKNGQTPISDAEFSDPKNMTPKKLGDAGYRYFSDPTVARAYRQSMQALTQLKRIDKDVDELYRGVDPGMNIANALALKVKRGMGHARALQLRRTILETLPTMALAEGMTAGRLGETILGEFELPQFPTDRDSYQSAKTAVQTLQQRLGNNVNIFRGTGINPALVEEATGLAEEGQSMPAAQTKPPSYVPLQNTVHVRMKRDPSKTGWIPPNEFNETLYERIP